MIFVNFQEIAQESDNPPTGAAATTPIYFNKPVILPAIETHVLSRTRKTKQKFSENKIRIIGGHWRGRKLSVGNEEGLRPTGDRIRETLFNWLMPYIHNAQVLDGFAGTGALGLEALSRGARQCHFIEFNPHTAAALRDNLALLAGSESKPNAQVCIGNFLEHIAQLTTTFDLIFLDPPFSQELWQQAIDALERTNIMANNTLVYIESDRNRHYHVPPHWQLVKEKSTGAIAMRLFLCTSEKS